jgi:DNA gyrase subunit A
MKVANISELGRATQGVKLIRIDEGDEIAAITQINVDEEENAELIEIEEKTTSDEATNLNEESSQQENGVPS